MFLAGAREGLTWVEDGRFDCFFPQQFIFLKNINSLIKINEVKFE